MTSQTNRRQFTLAGLAALALPAAALAQAQANAVQQVDVWKSPTCGCCKDWIAHMEKSGFRFTVHETGNTAARQRMLVADAPASLSVVPQQDIAARGADWVAQWTRVVLK